MVVVTSCDQLVWRHAISAACVVSGYEPRRVAHKPWREVAAHVQLRIPLPDI